MYDKSASDVIIGVAGASGTIYAHRLLLALNAMPVTTHLVVSRAAKLTASYEMPDRLDIGPATHRYGIADVGARIASGSFLTRGMIIAPCSVRTMSEIATGVTSSLLTRAADVCLKEKRPLILMVRETPLHLGHLRTMTTLSEMGAIIAPPLPAFYADPQSLDDIVDQSVGRVLDLLGLHAASTKRWRADDSGSDESKVSSDN